MGLRELEELARRGRDPLEQRIQGLPRVNQAAAREMADRLRSEGYSDEQIAVELGRATLDVRPPDEPTTPKMAELLQRLAQQPALQGALPTQQAQVTPESEKSPYPALTHLLQGLEASTLVPAAGIAQLAAQGLNPWGSAAVVEPLDRYKEDQAQRLHDSRVEAIAESGPTAAVLAELGSFAAPVSTAGLTGRVAAGLARPLTALGRPAARALSGAAAGSLEGAAYGALSAPSGQRVDAAILGGLAGAPLGGLGAATNPALRPAAQREMVRYFSPTGEVPSASPPLRQVIHDAMVSKSGFVREQAYVAQQHVKEMDKLLRKAPEGLEVVDDIMNGIEPDTDLAHPDLVEAASMARQQIDRMSQAVLDELDLSDPLRATIEQNLGSYKYRSYRIFSDDLYAERVSDPSSKEFQEAFSYLVERRDAAKAGTLPFERAQELNDRASAAREVIARVEADPSLTPAERLRSFQQAVAPLREYGRVAATPRFEVPITPDSLAQMRAAAEGAPNYERAVRKAHDLFDLQDDVDAILGSDADAITKLRQVRQAAAPLGHQAKVTATPSIRIEPPEGAVLVEGRLAKAETLRQAVEAGRLKDPEKIAARLDAIGGESIGARLDLDIQLNFDVPDLQAAQAATRLTRAERILRLQRQVETGAIRDPQAIQNRLQRLGGEEFGARFGLDIDTRIDPPDLAASRGITPGLAGLDDAALEARVRQLGDRDEAASFLKTSGLKQKVVGRRREDLPEPLRVFLGEEKDPRVSYLRSVRVLAEDIGTYRAAKAIREEGLRTGEFVESPTGAAYKSLGAGDGPLAELYATRNLADDFNQFLHVPVGDTTRGGLLARAYRAFNGGVKLGFTVANVPAGPVRNAVVWPIFSVMTGHAPLPARAMRRAYQDMVSHGDGASFVQLAHRHGIMGESTSEDYIQRYVADLEGSGLPAGRKVFGAMAKIWGLGDDGGRTMIWMAEYDALRRRLPEASPQALMEEAAKRTRAMTPTASEEPLIAEKLRRFPLAGPFPGFYTGIVRGMVNTLRIAAEDIQRPATRGLGVRRLLGLASSVLVVPEVAKVGVEAASRVFFGGDQPTDEQRQAVGMFLPDYARGADMALLSVDEDGDVFWSDLSFSMPSAVLRAPVIAAVRAVEAGRDVRTAIAEAGIEAIQPWLGEEPVVGAAVDVAGNQGRFGERISEEGESRTAESVKYLARTLAPGLVKRLIKLAGVEADQDDPRIPTGAREVLSAAGLSIQAFNVKKALHWRALDYVERRRSLIRGARKRADLETGTLPLPEARQEQWRELVTLYNAARQLKLSEGDVAGILKEAGVPSVEIGWLVGGLHDEPPPLDMDKILQDLKDRQKYRDYLDGKPQQQVMNWQHLRRSNNIEDRRGFPRGSFVGDVPNPFTDDTFA